uniref:Uncharacterized protein n=1 Tax=Aegilops tauschii subsp. strangulata TaxID=200361 RepID=A0A453JRC0_AEGTS
MECSGDEVVELNCARAGGDPGEYAAVLKRKLQLYCAAVAKTMEGKPQESSLNCLSSQASDTSPLVSQASFDCVTVLLFKESQLIVVHQRSSQMMTMGISRKIQTLPVPSA